MVDGDGGSGIDAVLLGAGHHLGGHGRRDLRGVIGALGQRGETQVAFERDDFRFARRAGKAEPAGIEAFIHHTRYAEIGILRLVRQHNPEIPGIGEGAA